MESGELKNFHERQKSKELIQIAAQALQGHLRSKWIKNTAATSTCNVNLIKAIDDVLKEKVEWMKKTTFPSETNPKEPIEEIVDDLGVFENGMTKLTKKELVKDVIMKTFLAESMLHLLGKLPQMCGSQ